VRSWEDVAARTARAGSTNCSRPAERYARDGFAVTGVVADYFALNEALLRADDGASELFLRGGLPRAGDVLRNEPLARVAGVPSARAGRARSTKGVSPKRSRRRWPTSATR
jgi:gamma-glutamyltranspeptidase